MYIKSPNEVAKRERKAGAGELSGESHAELKVGCRPKTDFAPIKKRLGGDSAGTQQSIAVELELMTSQLAKKVLDTNWPQKLRNQWNAVRRNVVHLQHHDGFSVVTHQQSPRLTRS